MAERRKDNTQRGGSAGKTGNAAREACGTPKTMADIREHMDVIASCGKRVGMVDHLEGRSIKLTKNDSTAGGKHHFIPLDWVATVDEHVHLKKNSEEVARDWKSEPATTPA